MKLITEVAFFFLIFFCLLSLAKRNSKPVLWLLIIYISFSDFVLYYFGYNIGELSVAKLVVEIVFASALLFHFSMIFKENSHGKREIKVYALLLASLVLLFYGAIFNGVVNAMNGWRSLFLFIFLAEILFGLDRYKERFLSSILNATIFVSAFNSVIAVFDYYTYTGDYGEIWRYQLLLEAKLQVSSDFSEHFMKYQMERGENLRAAGIMVSALSFGFLNGLALVFCFNKIAFCRSRTVLALLGISVFLISMGVYVSQVRTAILIPVIAIVLAIAIKRFALRKRSILIISTIGPVVIIASGVIFLRFLDPSAAGRIYQYTFLVENFRFPGYGLGSYLSQFDSFYIYSLMSLGVFAFALYYYLMSVAFAATGNVNINLRSSRSKALLLACYLALFFVMAVQHVASSPYYFVVLLVGAYLKGVGTKNWIKMKPSEAC